MRFFEFKVLSEGTQMSVKILDNKKLGKNTPYGAVGTGDLFLQLLANEKLHKEIQDETGNVFTKIVSQANAITKDAEEYKTQNKVPITSNTVDFEQMLVRHGITTTDLNKINKTEVFGSTRKEKYAVKPSDVFPGEHDEGDITQIEKVIAQHSISGKNLEKVILGSPSLSDPKNPLGVVITEIVKNMTAGKMSAPAGDWWTADNGQMAKALRDYAGEYLGVVALVNGLANVPSETQLKKFLGINDYRDLNFYFPRKSNVPLADSFGYAESPTQKMNISSKGGTKGAAPSVTALKISDSLRSNPEYSEEIAFIELVQKSSEFGGAFRMYGLLHDVSGDAMQLVANKPNTQKFSEQDIQHLKAINAKGRKLSAEQQEEKINEIEHLREYYGELKTYAGTKGDQPIKSPIGFMRYYTQKIVLDAVNKHNALPEFQKIVREILGDNFMQIYTDISGNPEKGGEVKVRILYPADITEEVKVGVASKSSQTKMGGKLAFSISPKSK